MNEEHTLRRRRLLKMNALGISILEQLNTTGSIQPVISVIKENTIWTDCIITDELYKIPLERWSEHTGMMETDLPGDFVMSKTLGGQSFPILKDGNIFVRSSSTGKHVFIICE